MQGVPQNKKRLWQKSVSFYAKLGHANQKSNNVESQRRKQALCLGSLATVGECCCIWAFYVLMRLGSLETVCKCCCIWAH